MSAFDPKRTLAIFETVTIHFYEDIRSLAAMIEGRAGEESSPPSRLPGHLKAGASS